MRTSIKAALVAAATATLLAPVGAAFADSAKIDDATNDTWSVTYDDQGNPTYAKADDGKYFMFGGAYHDADGKWQTGGAVFAAGSQSGRGTTCKGFKSTIDW